MSRHDEELAKQIFDLGQQIKALREAIVGRERVIAFTPTAGVCAPQQPKPRYRYTFRTILLCGNDRCEIQYEDERGRGYVVASGMTPVDAGRITALLNDCDRIAWGPSK